MMTAKGLNITDLSAILHFSLALPTHMDDDVFGTAVWGLPSYTLPTRDSDPSSSTLVAEDIVRDTLAIPPPPSTTTSSEDQFDDFDDFGTPAETAAGDDDFGDFGDFGDIGEIVQGGSEDFPQDDIGFGEEVQIFDVPPISEPINPLQLDPMPERNELVRQVNGLMDHVCREYDADGMTDEPLREREGLDQILVTPESREIYRILLPSITPPMQPVNWTRSRIRRQHLISLGIPINLDEVLPRTVETLPTMKINTRTSSVPPGLRNGAASSRPGSSSNSRAGSPRLQTSEAAQLRLGAKPELDERVINGLLDLTPENMNLSTLATLEGQRANLRLQTVNTSTLLTYLLQTRDALRQDSETYNKLIAELVGEAQKIKTGGKTKVPTRMGSGS